MPASASTRRPELDLLPSSRRRLEPTPLGIDQPAWVVEDKIDLDYHIRHAALPKPGGMEELRALIAQLHAVPLDRSRPLWEYHFIEGLEGGAFAVYVKVHHSTMDALAGMATLGVTFDFAPGAEHETMPQRIVPPDVEPSDFIELTSTAVGDFIRQGWRAVTSLPGVARALTKVAPNFGRDARFLFSYVKDMPRTPFNVAISAHRVYATSSLPLPDVRALARSRGVTINDVVLALCAGALRRYLAEHAALPEKALTAGVPASLRPLGNAQLNNQVVFTLSRLPTDVAEPLPRLAAAQAAGREAKNFFSDMRDLVTTDVSILGAPLVVTALARLWAGGARTTSGLSSTSSSRTCRDRGRRCIASERRPRTISPFRFPTTAARSTSPCRAISISSTSASSPAARPCPTRNASPISSSKTSRRCARPTRS